jgi:hypothetical protein
MRRVAIAAAFSVIAIGTAATAVLAVDQASTNYQNFDSSAIPTQFIQNSTSYRLDASVEPIVGLSNSVSYKVEHGSPLKEGTPPVPPVPPTPPTPGGGGGGGGGGALPLPPGTTVNEQLTLTLEYRSPTFLRTQNIRGDREDAISVVIVNGSQNGVLLTSGGWQRTMPLFLGENTIAVQGLTGNNQTKLLEGAVRRLLIGDVNLDHVVDDYDLSMLVRRWGSGEFMANFNEDGIVNNADLSLLTAYWGVIY